MLNILHVARAPVTGVWSSITNLALCQMSLGHRVGICVLAPNNWPAVYHNRLFDLERKGIDIFSYGSPSVFGTAAFAIHQFVNPVSKCIDKFSEDKINTVIHMHNAWLSGALINNKVAQYKLCATYHGIAGEHRLSNQPIRRFIHSHWARRLEIFNCKIVSVDNETPLKAKCLFGVKSSTFSVIANGLSVAPGLINGCPRLMSSGDQLTVGHVGVIDDGKGWRITAEAVRLAVNRGYSVRFLIAGDGPESKDAEAWCDQYSNFAKFIGYSKDPMVEVFPKIDILALPSLTEGLPMVVIEALAFGIPVIATPVGGIPNAIVDGFNGFIISRDVDNLFRKIEELYKKIEMHADMSNNAKKFFDDNYKIESICKKYIYEYLR